MATADQYAEWIVKNSDKRGTPEFETVAQAYQQAKAEEAQSPVTASPKEATIGDKLAGLGEAGLTLATGATTGMVGALGGVAKTIGQNYLYGQSDGLEKNVVQGMQAGTYMPSTEKGQEYVGDIGAAASLLPPVLPQIAGVNAIGQAVRQQAPLLQATARRAALATGTAAREAGATIAKPIQAATDAVRGVVGMEPSPSGRASVGAAATPQELQRRTVAATMPVPFEGESALTKGQATRDYDQLKFEKETAKQGEEGAPLRNRVENQSATLLSNFDVLMDRPGPITFDKIDIGRGVTEAIKNKMNVKKNAITKAYTAAEEAGEMSGPVDLVQTAEKLNDLTRFEGVAGNIAPIKQEAIRLGAVLPNEDGTLTPGTVKLQDAELLRQFVNEATDWGDKRQALMARRINETIDASTDGKGGELYQKARKLHSESVREFENVGLTAKLLGTKRGTDERAIALDDVFDRVIMRAPVEEMNKTRKTLLTAGPDGRQAWANLKAKGIETIKELSLSQSQRDSRGNPIVSVDKMNRIISKLDSEGKLESLYGKKQAQILRDLAEIAKDIYTAPPGSINTSNTASALSVAFDSMGTFVVTGIPAPATTAIRELAKYAKNRKVKARIESALKDTTKPAPEAKPKF